MAVQSESSFVKESSCLPPVSPSLSLLSIRQGRFAANGWDGNIRVCEPTCRRAYDWCSRFTIDGVPLIMKYYSADDFCRAQGFQVIPYTVGSSSTPTTHSLVRSFIHLMGWCAPGFFMLRSAALGFQRGVVSVSEPLWEPRPSDCFRSPQQIHVTEKGQNCVCACGAQLFSSFFLSRSV